MDSLAGRMKFRVEGEDRAFAAEKPYIKVCYDVSISALASYIIEGWNVRAPDILVTVCSGIRSSRSWRKDEHRYALQRGFTKLFNTANAWIFTHGYNQGVAKLIGEAVKQEEDRRWHSQHRGRTACRIFNKKLPKIFLCGVSSKSMLRDPEPFDATPKGQLISYEFGDHQVRQRYDLNPYHTHFIIVNESDYLKTVQLRVELEKELHLFANQRKTMYMDNLSDSSSDEEEDFPTLDDDQQQHVPSEVSAVGEPALAANAQLASTANRKALNDTIPIVCIFVQGGPLQLDQLLSYLRASTPCVLIKGSGLMADIIAGVYDEVFAESSQVNEQELLSLQTDMLARLKRQFTRELPHRKAVEQCYEKITNVMRLAFQDGQQFLSVFNLKIASDLVDLDKFILKALFAGQDVENFKNPEQVRNDLLLTVKWNHAKLAQTNIFQTEGWSKIKIDKDIFDQALILKGREAFIDIFLEQGFRVHKYLTHRRYLNLFRRAEDTEFFHSVVLEGLLSHTPGSPLHEDFIIHELNPLIFQLAKLKEFLNEYIMTRNAYGAMMPFCEDATRAERRALLALLVWAIMMNRYELAVIIWKHIDQPIPTALFASHLYTKMSKLSRETEVVEELYKHGKQFSQKALDILDLGYKDGGTLAYEALETHYSEFNEKTPIIMAYESRNRWFLAHQCCQKWLNRVYRGKIDVTRHNLGWLGKFLPDSLKIVLSAWFILPMFVWIRFPKEFVDLPPSKPKTLRQDSSISERSKRRLQRLAKLRFGSLLRPNNGTLPSKKETKLSRLQKTTSLSLPTAIEEVRITPSTVASPPPSGVASTALRPYESLMYDEDEMGSGGFDLRSSVFRVRVNTLNTLGPNGVVPLKSHVVEQDARERELHRLANEQQRARRRGVKTISNFTKNHPSARDAEAELPFWRKLYYVWQAPVTKFWTCLLAYVAFLVVYSVAAFEPDCADIISATFALDAVVWLWTALITIELALRTWRQSQIGVPFNLRRRFVEISVLTVFLVLYVLIRTLNLALHLFSPYTSRLIMLNGLLYFYFRLITIFFPISRELGPLLVKARVMLLGALWSFMKLVGPFFFAYMIIIQVVLYPDKPLSWDVLHQAFHRHMFSLFLTPITELTESGACVGRKIGAENRTRMRTSSGQSVQCSSGMYDDASCPSGGFWSYLFMLQWFFIYKLVLSTLLYAIFTAYTLRVDTESEHIWKYQRFQVVLDIATRSALPPPISILSHLAWAATVLLAAIRQLVYRYDRRERRRQEQQDSSLDTTATGGVIDNNNVVIGGELRRRATLPRELQLFPLDWGDGEGGNNNGDGESNVRCDVVGKQATALTDDKHVANYWKLMARQYWRDRQTDETEKSKPDKQYSTIIALKEELDAARASIRRLRSRLIAQERSSLMSSQMDRFSSRVTP